MSKVNIIGVNGLKIGPCGETVLGGGVGCGEFRLRLPDSVYLVGWGCLAGGAEMRLFCLCLAVWTVPAGLSLSSGPVCVRVGGARGCSVMHCLLAVRGGWLLEAREQVVKVPFCFGYQVVDFGFCCVFGRPVDRGKIVEFV